MEFAGRHGYGLLLNYYNKSEAAFRSVIARFVAAHEVCDERKRPPKIATIQHLYIALSESEAQAVPRRAFMEYQESLEEAFARSRPHESGTTSAEARLRFESYRSDKLCFGTPETILQRIAYLRELGVTDVLFMTQFGSLPWSVAHQTQAKFDEFILARMASL